MMRSHFRHDRVAHEIQKRFDFYKMCKSPYKKGNVFTAQCDMVSEEGLRIKAGEMLEFQSLTNEKDGGYDLKFLLNDIEVHLYFTVLADYFGWNFGGLREPENWKHAMELAYEEIEHYYRSNEAATRRDQLHAKSA